MYPTVFSNILEKLVQALPGALGAAFIDWEGEAVDTFCRIRTDEIRLIAAHWGIIYRQVRSALTKVDLDAPRELILDFGSQQVVIRRVTDDYVVVVALNRGSNLGRALGMLSWAEKKLREQM